MLRLLKPVLLLALCAALLLTAGCKYSQREEGENAIHVEKDEEISAYRLSTVRRGDITLTETVRVTYFAARSETYGFGETGVYYGDFNVSVGDAVRAGDVLALLDSQELDQQIAALETRREALTVSIERAESLMALYDEREAGREGVPARRRGYEVAARDAGLEIEVIDTQLSELRARKEKRVITADIDGTVTFVRDISPGETSVNGRKVITVTDLDACVFATSVEHPEALDGDAVYIVPCSGADYEAKLATAEELGIEDTPLNEKSTRTKVYFRLLTPSVDLNEDSGGRFTVTVDSREDALYVPVGAVVDIGGRKAIYVPDDAGMRSVRYVETGLATARWVEIISGVSEGETIILN